MEKYTTIKQSNERDSYKTYLAKLGAITPTVEEAEARLAGEASFKDAEYGASGEALAVKGLTGSGYSSYLNSLIAKNNDKEIAKAIRASKIDEYKRISGYRRYVESYNSAQEKIKEGVIERIKEIACFDKDRAYNMALEAGLSKENAMFTATRGIILAKQEAILEAIEYSRKNDLYSYSARKYALNIGLDEHSADLVAASVTPVKYGEISDYSTITPQSYLNILKERADNATD